MSILNTIFGNPQPKAADPTPTPGEPTKPAEPPKDPIVPETPKTPLEAYKDLWNTDPNKQQEANGPVINFDKEKLSEVTNKLKFTDNITPETLAKVVSGGEGAVEALVEIINASGRQNYMSSVETATYLINNALDSTQQKITGSIPDLIKKATVSNNLRSENPMFNNPAVAPLLQAVEAQLSAKYPDASADEITKHAKEYLEGFATMFSPQAPSTNSNQPKETDWGNYFNT